MDHVDNLLSQAQEDPKLPPYERSRLFEQAASFLEKAGHEIEAQRATWEQVAFDFRACREAHRRGKPERRFAERLKADGFVYPTFEILNDGGWDYLRDQFGGTNNPAVKARYGDLLWEAHRDHSAARKAAKAYLAIASLYIATQDFTLHSEAVDALVRAVELGALLNDLELLNKSVLQAVDTAKKLALTAPPHQAASLVNSLLSNRKARKHIDIGDLKQVCERTIEQIGRSSNDPWDDQRRWLVALRKLFFLEDDHAGARSVQIRIAQTYEQEGDHTRATRQRANMVADHFYREAIAAYKTAGKCTDEVNRLLVKCEQATRAAMADMGLIAIPVAIDADTWERQREAIVQGVRHYGLRLCGEHALLPDIAAIRTSVEQELEKHPFWAMMPRTAMVDDRVVNIAQTPKEIFEVEVSQAVYRAMLVSTHRLTSWAIEAFRDQGGSVSDELVSIVSASPLFTRERDELLSVGFDRYEVRDYISSIHILVFQIEGLLRDFAVGLRKPATDDHDGITQARPLGDLLASQKLRENLGGNLIAFLKVLLADQAAGFNARHNVAHGLVGASWFDKTIADLLLVTIIQLASFRPDVSYAPQP